MDPEAIDAEFLAVGLEPLAPFTAARDERLCRCSTCGTDRWVRLSNLRQGGIACRWCHGWERETAWSVRARSSALTYGRPLGTVEESLNRLEMENLAPLTPVGDLLRPVGVVCLRCGETMVAVPARISPQWEECARCNQERKRAVKADAGALFEANGLQLLGPCHGEYQQQRARCMTCGTVRGVSYNDLRHGSAPLCWTCTYGIRPDEPHRVYLIHFPGLKVMKIGLTHNRHDRRLLDHALSGGRIVDTVLVPDRESARRLEQVLRARYSRWATDDVGPAEFPQGGWTETWRDEAPLPNLEAEASAAFIEVLK